MRYFKTVDGTGQLTRLDNSGVNVSGSEITKVEYDMTRVGIKIFINGDELEKIKGEEWWK